MKDRITEKIRRIRINRYMLLLAAFTAVFAIVLAVNMTKGESNVEFRVLDEAEVPKDIATNVVPEYRGLERALACCLDDKIYVLVTRGEKPTSGYELSIEKMEIEREDGIENLVVYANFKDPEPGDSLSQVLTYPLKIAETGLTELPDTIELRVKY